MTPPIIVGVDPLRHDPEAPVLAALLARATGAPVVAVAAYPHESPATHRRRRRSRGGAPRRPPWPACRRSSRRSTASPLETDRRRRAVRGARARTTCAEDRGAGLLVVGSTHHGAHRADRARQHGRPAAARGAVPGRGRAARLRRAHARHRPHRRRLHRQRRGPRGAAGRRRPRLGVRRRAARRHRGRAHRVERHEPRAALRRRGSPRGSPRTGRGTAARRRSTACCRRCRRTAEVLVNSPVTALEQFSNEVDLLVCGSRGYGPLGSVLLGGVSRRLIHRAACPVIVVPRGTERAIEALPAPRTPWRPAMPDTAHHLRGVRPPRPHVVIAGGGVAAIEALLALRHLVGRQVTITLLAPERSFVHRPSSVAGPFGLGGPAPLDLAAIARDHGAELRARHARRRRPERRVVVLAGGEAVAYDMPRRRRRRRGGARGAGRHHVHRARPGRRGRRAARPRRARRGAPARLRGPGRGDLVAADLRARDDGRRRPARPRRRRTPRWASSRPSPSRCGSSAARPAPRCARCSTPAGSRCGPARGRSGLREGLLDVEPARRCAPTR